MCSFSESLLSHRHKLFIGQSLPRKSNISQSEQTIAGTLEFVKGALNVNIGSFGKGIQIAQYFILGKIYAFAIQRLSTGSLERVSQLSRSYPLSWKSFKCL